MVAWLHQAIAWTKADLISEIMWHLPMINITGSAQDFNSQNEFEKYIFKITSTYLRS